MSNPIVIDQRRMDHVPAAPGARDAAQATRPAIEITIHHQLEAVEAEWRRFERDADCTGFQAFDWLAAWCRHIGPLARTQPAIVVGRDDAGATLFILPLAVTPGMVRRLTWLGSDLCDYNGPLLAKACASRLTPDALPRIVAGDPDPAADRPADPSRSHRADQDAGAGRGAGQPAACARGRPESEPRLRRRPVRDLDRILRGQAVVPTRRRDRSKLKRLGKIGAVRFVTPQDRGEIERSVNVLIEQKSRSFARMGVANMFDRPGWSEFFAAVATDERMRGLVHVSRLDVGTTWSAVNLGLTFRDTYCHVLASYDDGETSRFGAGVAHLRELMRYAIEHGFRHFDFTIGDERYKLEWSDRTLVLYDHVAPASARGWAAAAMVHGHRRLKRFIKQNEALWSLFSRARAAIGLKSAAPAAEDSARESGQKSPPIAPT